MKIEKEVCSLEPAKRLKELGVKQDSYFVWIVPFKMEDLEHFYDLDEKRHDLIPRQSVMPSNVERPCYAAPTVAELGEIIKRIKGQVVTYFNNYKKDFGIQWVGDYDHEKDMTPNEYFEGDTEANARAKLVIYGIENDLIETEDI